MDDLDAAADAALAAALADTPTGGAPAAVPPLEPDTAAGDETGEDAPVDVVAQPVTDLANPDGEPWPQLDATEAKKLVKKARAAIQTLHEVMLDIIRGRAWLALGYDDPQQFWRAEFGGDDGGYSRAHLYRTARMLGLLYSLYERIGDDTAAIDITERALRALPRGTDGDADARLVDDIAAGVDALGDGYTADDVKAVADRVVEEAIRRHDNETTPTDRDLSAAGIAERLAALGLDAPPGMTGGGGGDARWDALPDEDRHRGGHDADDVDWGDNTGSVKPAKKPSEHFDDVHDPTNKNPMPFGPPSAAAGGTVEALMGDGDTGEVVLDADTRDRLMAAKIAGDVFKALATVSNYAAEFPAILDMLNGDEVAQLQDWADGLRRVADLVDQWDEENTTVDFTGTPL